jgi:hypothetical protein
LPRWLIWPRSLGKIWKGAGPRAALAAPAAVTLAAGASGGAPAAAAKLPVESLVVRIDKGTGDVYVSRVNSDGTIGNPVVIGDLNGDGIVDGSDLAALLGAWGTCPGSPCPADLNGDGTVDGSDLAALLGHWTV